MAQGAVILGGASAVVCCWQNREKGHLKSAQKVRLPPRPRAPAPPRPRDASAGVASTNASREMSGALAREQAGGNPYAGQGAKWLQTPV